MKKLLIPFIALAMVLMMGSCSGSKEIAYFQNIDSISLAASKGLYDARIMPKDELTITVSGQDQEVVRPFNMVVNTTLNPNSASGSSSSSYGRLMPYLVDNNGDIRFPIIGKIHVMGLTKRECEDLILEKIRPYFDKENEPIVTVIMSSFRVTIIGEVGRAMVLPVTTEKMSVIEALAASGDLSIYGKRKNILLIREDETGEKSSHRIDLTDANIFNSPYYYVQQNDIIYVEPNTVKAKNSSIGSSTTIWFSFIGIVTSVASLLVNILRD